MEINSKRLGKIEVKKEKIITFPVGIPGFENITKYILLEEPQTNGTFFWLQAVEDEDISLLITKPHFFMDYKVEIKKQLLEEIGIEKAEQGEIFTVVTLPEDFSKATTNLMAPIIFNSEKMQGQQIILTDTTYPIKHPLFKSKQQGPKGEG